ncbi:MAG: hypothetical protein V4598_00355 [Bdellovibrionota bacterium]
MIAFLMQSSLVLAQGCPEPQKLDDILTCLKNNHYLVQLKDYEVQNTQHLEKAMGQRPNPVLDVQTVHAGNARQTQIIVAQEIDLTGKLSALRKQGQIIHSVSKVQKSITQEEIVETVLLNIHHLLHVVEALRVNNEVFTSLDSVIQGLKRRPALNPEQEASLLNFGLQRAEVRNIIALLEDQEEEALIFFYLNGGYRKEQVLKVMEDHFHPLELISKTDGMSLNLERLGLETSLAQEELELQKANSWTGVSIGPMFMDDKMEDISEKLYGVALTMPIPLWQMNGANKARANVALSNSKRQFDLFKRKENIEKDSLVGRIEKLKSNLKELPKNSELAASHGKVEKLYGRGLISSTIYLDSHRVWRDVSSSKMELEEQILRLTIEYYRLAGQLNEVHL